MRKREFNDRLSVFMTVIKVAIDTFKKRLNEDVRW